MDALHRPCAPLSPESPLDRLLPPVAVDWQRVLDPTWAPLGDADCSATSWPDCSAVGASTMASPPLHPVQTPLCASYGLRSAPYQVQTVYQLSREHERYSLPQGDVQRDYPTPFLPSRNHSPPQHLVAHPSKSQYRLPSSISPHALYLAAYLTPGCTVGDVLARVPSVLTSAELHCPVQRRDPPVSYLPTTPPAALLSAPVTLPVKPFVAKLHAMLARPREYADVLTWDARGEVVVVRECARIVSEVFPAVFGHGKFASFTRQLNVYSFRRHPSSLLPTLLDLPASASTIEYSAWSHPEFTRANAPPALHLLLPKPSKARSEAKRAKAGSWAGVR
ncbi:hypothetical protein JCM3770_001397 [Rhodotorula araucariae]